MDPTECHRFIYYAIDATLAAADRASNPAVKTTGVLCMRDFGWVAALCMRALFARLLGRPDPASCEQGSGIVGAEGEGWAPLHRRPISRGAWVGGVET